MSLAPKTSKRAPAPCRTRTFDVSTRLDEIAAAIKAGSKPESFKDELDALLETEMVPRDQELDAHWEEGYRNAESDD